MIILTLVAVMIVVAVILGESASSEIKSDLDKAFSQPLLVMIESALDEHR